MKVRVYSTHNETYFELSSGSHSIEALRSIAKYSQKRATEAWALFRKNPTRGNQALVQDQEAVLTEARDIAIKAIFELSEAGCFESMGQTRISNATLYSHLTVIANLRSE